jgi:hypothetical protein
MGYEVEVMTRGFKETADYQRSHGKDLVKNADEDASGTHVVVFARKSNLA